ncbi:hypothetical protein KXX32_002033 [Aspergillus fumigatus]|nr:hypothetical protein KXX32_002033 [Aspergillus fumigatus]
MGDDLEASKSSLDRKEFPSAEHVEGTTVGIVRAVDPHQLESLPYGPSGFKGIFSSKYAFGAAFLASMGGFSMGYDMGVISIINSMDKFHAAYPRAESAFGKGFMTGMLLLGAFVGCIFMPYLADRISRKWALTAMVIVFNFGAILQTAATNYDMLVAGRFIGGIGVVSPPHMRGTLLVLESISITLGVVVAFYITYGTRHMATEACFRLPFGLQMVTATILGAGIHFFPYSPRWLALVNRQDDCMSSLCKLRGLTSSDERVQLEYQQIIAEINFQRAMDLFTRKLWKRTAVGVGVAFFQQFSGINAFIYYAPTLFESLGQTAETSLILSGVFNVLQLIAAIVCFLVIEKVGRRPLAIFGGFGTAVAYIIIAVLSGLYSTSWASHSAAGWGCVAMAFIFILIYGVTYSPLGWALPSEVFSTTSRFKGVALATCTIWLSDFIVGVVTPSMLADIGYRTYIFFAVMCSLAGIWAFFLVPETGGKSLEEIDELFGDSSAREEWELAQEAIMTGSTK